MSQPEVQNSLSRFRGVRAAAVLAFGLLAVPLGFAVAPSAAVVAIEPTPIADLILLNGGFNAGLRQGMVCRVTRGSQEIAEVLLVELRPNFSSALILSLAPKQSIRPGDLASIKVLKT